MIIITDVIYCANYNERQKKAGRQQEENLCRDRRSSSSKLHPLLFRPGESQCQTHWMMSPQAVLTHCSYYPRAEPFAFNPHRQREMRDTLMQSPRTCELADYYLPPPRLATSTRILYPDTCSAYHDLSIARKSARRGQRCCWCCCCVSGPSARN